MVGLREDVTVMTSIDSSRVPETVIAPVILIDCYNLLVMPTPVMLSCGFSMTQPEGPTTVRNRVYTAIWSKKHLFIELDFEW
jgi:hypothetical protein